MTDEKKAAQNQREEALNAAINTVVKNYREETFKTALNGAEAVDAHGDHSVNAMLKFYDAAADALKNGDAGAKAVKATIHGTSSNQDPDAKQYLTDLARYGNALTGLMNPQHHNLPGLMSTPEQEVEAIHVLKKYGISDPDGSLAKGLTTAAIMDARDHDAFPKASVMNTNMETSPVAVSSNTSPANRVVTAPKL
jgi:hypothetical protein